MRSEPTIDTYFAKNGQRMVTWDVHDHKLEIVLNIPSEYTSESMRMAVDVFEVNIMIIMKRLEQKHMFLLKNWIGIVTYIVCIVVRSTYAEHNYFNQSNTYLHPA